MRSGTKNCVVDVMRSTETRHPVDNTPQYDFTGWKSGIFARSEVRRGREVAVDGQIQAQTYMKFEFDYFDVEGIKTTDHIVHEGSRYEITAVLVDLNEKQWIAVDTTYYAPTTERA